MKWIGIAIVVVIVLALALMLNGKKADQQEERLASPPALAEETVPVSPRMQAFLDRKVGMWGVTPENFREYFDFFCHGIASHPDPTKAFPLDVVIDPDVKLTVGGEWRNMPFKSALDDLCQKNGLEWGVTGPDTIRISAKK